MTTRQTPETRCMPDPFCPCCECQGRMCIIPHPGHSHRGRDWALNRIEFAGRDDRMDPVSKATPESGGLEVSGRSPAEAPTGDFVMGHGQQSETPETTAAPSVLIAAPDQIAWAIDTARVGNLASFWTQICYSHEALRRQVAELTEEARKDHAHG